MKLFFLALVFPLFATAQGASLKDDMKQLKALLKQIVADRADDSKNEANAAAALQMVSLFHDAQTFTPESIAQLPPADKATALAQFRGLLEQEATMASELADAFHKKDHPTIDQILQKMADVKTQGHDRFDP